MSDDQLTAPFPYWGGKRRAAPEVWRRFGKVTTYIEPFGGTLAVLLACPFGPRPREVVNDVDGFIPNFWRAIRDNPEAVAYFADWPTSHLDLIARKSYCLDWLPTLQARLMSDPLYYDAEIAGYWVWAVSNDIGLFSERTAAQKNSIPRCSEKNGVAVSNIPHVDHTQGGQGITAQAGGARDESRPRVHHKAGGQGINAQTVIRRPTMHHNAGGEGIQAQRGGPQQSELRRPMVRTDDGGRGVSAQGRKGMPFVDHPEGVMAIRQDNSMPNINGTAGGKGVSAQVCRRIPNVNPEAGGKGVSAQGGGANNGRPLIVSHPAGAGVQAQAGSARPLMSSHQAGAGVQAQGGGATRPLVGHKPGGQGVSAQTGGSGSLHRRPYVRSDESGSGISVQAGGGGPVLSRPYLMPHAGGQGVAIQNLGPYATIPSPEVNVGARLMPAFSDLSLRLQRTYILCKDWATLCSRTVMGLTPSDLTGNRKPYCGIFLDPPYPTVGRGGDLYRIDSLDIAHRVRKWAIKMGRNPYIRIAVCGYAADYAEFPDDWTPYEWSTSQRRMGGKVSDYDRTEVIWFSPHCLRGDEQENQADFFGLVED